MGYNNIRPVDIITGCFLLLSKQSWDKLNGFSPDFFMYVEEADLCLRAIQIGVQPILYPEAKIIHYGGASEKIVADKMVRMLKAKNTLLRKHWRPPFLVWLGSRLYVLVGESLWQPECPSCCI